MPKRRMISQSIIIDQEFNGLSLTSQCVFVRILAVSDDYGVVPGSDYELGKLINTPKGVNLSKCVQEITDKGLAKRFIYESKPFLIFKRERFDDYQSYLIAKRTKSEYLRLSKEIMESEKFLEILGSSRENSETVSASIESIKQQVESRKIKEERSRPENLQEVVEYFGSLGVVDPAGMAQAWWDHKEANGWKVGKNPIVDWKATCRTWKRNNFEVKNGTGKTERGYRDGSQSSRASFKHGPEDIERFRNAEASLRAIEEEHRRKSGV